MVGAHVHQAAELREAKLSVQIVLDVLRHTSEPALGQASGRLIGNDRHRKLLQAPGSPRHYPASPPRPPWTSASRFRRNSRARCTRDFTLGTLRPKDSAASICDRPSTSCKMRTVR